MFTYIWLIFMVDVGKDTIHGSYGFLERGTIERKGEKDRACFLFFFWAASVISIDNMFFIYRVF